MGDSYTASQSVALDLVRLILSFLDRPVYWLSGLIYQLFFVVASADMFSNDTILKFYGRVQVILGVFMMFQLAMTILRGIIEPDNFTKDKGAGSLIRRVIISLILITVLMPISISSPRNEYEKQLNNNGLLFGTLYSLQHRILTNNTLGRLILGTKSSESTYMSGDSEDLKQASRVFTATVLKGFYRINLVPEDERVDTGMKDPATKNENRMCKDIDDDILKAYTRVDAEPGEIISMVNETCTVKKGFLGTGLGSTKKYVFNYMPLVPMIVGIVFIFILLSFTIDVAVRAVKLAVLRLLAPIPLISYMNPNGSGDEAFKSWTKALTSTYLDLFIRLAVVYFVIFIIQDMIMNGFTVMNASWGLRTLAQIILWIALFVFAKQAPKFIKQVLGLKGDTGKLFGGLAELAALGTVAAGTASGGISNAVAKAKNTSGNAGKKAAAAIGGLVTGAVGGGVNAGKGFFSSEKADAKGNMARIREYNARNYSNSADDSTARGRMLVGLQDALGLRNQKQVMDEQMKYYGAAKEAMSRMNDAFGSNGSYKHQYNGPDIRDDHGNIVLKGGDPYSLKEYKDKLGRVQASGNEALIASVDDAMKKAQGARLTHLRTTFTGKTREEARGKLIAAIKAEAGNDNPAYTQRDLDVFDGAYTIYTAGQKYSDKPFFRAFKGKDFSDSTLTWAVFKTAASSAGDTAANMKASPEYDTASANANRVSKKKNNQ